MIDKDLSNEYYRMILSEMDNNDFYEELGLSDEKIQQLERLQDGVDKHIDSVFEMHWGEMSEEDMLDFSVEAGRS